MRTLLGLFLTALVLVGCQPHPAPSASNPTSAAGAPTSSAGTESTDTKPTDAEPTDMSPTAVLESYYAAINARDFQQAYDLWGDGGAASGQTFEAFAAGFKETASVSVEVGTPGHVEGAAGSRYIEIPVTLQAETTAGESQRFEDTYTLRRSVVEGSTAEQRRWHLYSADISRKP